MGDILGKTRAFDSELDLQKRLEVLDFLDYEKSEAVYFRREVRIGKIIPDLVCIHFMKLPSGYMRRASWSFRHASLLATLRRYHRLRLDTLARLTYERQPKVDKLLQDLVYSGAVTKSPTGSYSISKQMSSIQAEVIAVEAKLERWNEALQQAVEYRRFADRVCVAMDYDCMKFTEVPTSEFVSRGVGLLSVSHTHITRINRGRKNKCSGPEREYLINSPFSKSHKSWVRR